MTSDPTIDTSNDIHDGSSAHDQPPEAEQYLDKSMAREEFIARGRVFVEDLHGWMRNRSHARQSLAPIQRFTRAHDQLIGLSLAHASERWQADTGKPVPRVALVAMGGYGRRMQLLRSDVDLMVLMAEQTPDHEQFVKILMLTLIDLRLDLGYATRTLPDCLMVLGIDVESATAMTECRWVAGSRALFNQAFDAIREAINGKWRRWFLRAIFQQLNERRAKYESTIYLLEPNLKEGNGGLRDVHTVQWAQFALTGSMDPRNLIEAIGFTEDDVREYREAVVFITVIRNQLHVVCDSKTDQLLFQFQPRIAERMGYESTTDRSAEEIFMGDYYAHARTVQRYSRRALNMLAQRERSLLGDIVGSFKRRKFDRHLVVQGDILYIDDKFPTYFEDEPRRILHLFEVAAKWGYRVSDRTIDRLARIAPHLGPGFRLDPANRDSFMRLLRGPLNVHRALAEMHESGILSRFLPEFERLRSMVRIDHYHHYTVDEHTFRALEMAERMQRAGHESRALVNRIAMQIKRWDLLNLALLLHDVGKGYGRGHALRGGQIAQRVGDRMQLKPADTDTVRFLVLSHLKLTHASQRRDLSDPAVARGLADEIGSLERLKMLYVHSVCDLMAVSPDAWNSWKEQLLDECYLRTAEVLGGKAQDEVRPAPMLDQLQGQILKILAEDSPKANRSRQAPAPPSPPMTANPGAVREFLEHVSERYIQRIPPQAMAIHFKLRRQLSADNLVEWSLEPGEGSFSEIVICAVDLPGLFSNICGALAAKGINIWSAQIFTTNDGYAINTFQVTDFDNKPLPAGMRLDRLRTDLNAVLKGEKDIMELIEKHRTRRRKRGIAPQPYPARVQFDNASSQHYTVVEIRSADRPGLLFRITRAMNECQLDIHRSMIATEAYGIVDVFYVTDLEYNKIRDSNAQNKIEKAIMAAIEKDDFPV